MTDLVTPGEYGDASAIDPRQTAHAIDKAGVGSWIVDGVDLAGLYSVVDETVLNGFVMTTTSGSLDVTFDPGEAYVGGWLCRDTSTTVTLDPNVTNFIYIGYDAGATLNSGQAPSTSQNIIIGPASDFSDGDPRTILYEINTDDSAVMNYFDHRLLQKPISVDQITREMKIHPRLDLLNYSLIDNSDGDGIVPAQIDTSSGDVIPPGTYPGRLVYDIGREE